MGCADLKASSSSVLPQSVEVMSFLHKVLSLRCDYAESPQELNDQKVNERLPHRLAKLTLQTFKPFLLLARTT